MKLALTRGGGIAGLRKPPVELDTAALPADAASRLRALVDGADLAAHPRGLGDDHPDQLGYTLAVTHDDGRTDTLDLTLAAAPPPVRALVDEIRRLAKP